MTDFLKLRTMQADHGSEIPYATLVQADKLQLLYQQSFPAVFFSLLAGLMITAILWSHTSTVALVIWLAGIGAASIFRLLLFIAYSRARPEGEAVLAWAKPYLFTLMLSSSIWGMGSLWVMPKDSLLYPAIIYYFLIGMAGGALSVYSAIRSFAITTLVLVLVPITVWMLLHGERTALIMGCAAVLFLVSAVRATKVLSKALHQSFLLTHELKQANAHAEHMARTDALTGLSNRWAFMDIGEKTLHICRRNRQPVTAIIVDIDHFKRINDTRGHATGDQALQHIGRLILDAVRDSDVSVRLGGEEFAVLLPNTALEEGLLVAEKLRRTIEQTPTLTAEGEFCVTASVGVAADIDSLETLLNHADAAMYRAKAAGRNRVAT